LAAISAGKYQRHVVDLGVGMALGAELLGVGVEMLRGLDLGGEIGHALGMRLVGVDVAAPVRRSGRLGHRFADGRVERLEERNAGAAGVCTAHGMEPPVPPGTAEGARFAVLIIRPGTRQSSDRERTKSRALR
jgi:hypothetical protein